MAILSEKRQKCFGLRRKDVRMRAIICDDDGRFAKKLEQLIMQYYRNMGMTIDTTVVTNPQNLLKRNDLANFDIAFLDADMKPIDGIEVGRALRKRKPKIIIVFVSAYLEFAPKGCCSSPKGLEPIAAGLSGVDHRRSTLSARRRAANGDPPPVGAKTYATGGTTGPRTPSLRRTAGANPNTGVGGGLHIERARRRETPAGVRYHGRQRHGAGRDAESGDTDPGERTHAAAAPFAKPAGRNERTGRAVRPAR